MVKVVDSRVALKRIARKAITQSRVKLAQRSVAQRTVAHSRVARPGTTLQETNISLAPWEEQNHLQKCFGGDTSVPRRVLVAQSLWTLLRATKQKKETPERACFFYASLFCHIGYRFGYRSARHIFTLSKRIKPLQESSLTPEQSQTHHDKSKGLCCAFRYVNRYCR